MTDIVATLQSIFRDVHPQVDGVLVASDEDSQWLLMPYFEGGEVVTGILVPMKQADVLVERILQQMAIAEATE